MGNNDRYVLEREPKKTELDLLIDTGIMYSDNGWMVVIAKWCERPILTNAKHDPSLPH